jgi:hypothetical protein
MNKREQILAALKGAKPFLSKTYRCGDKDQFICHAFNRAWGWGKIDRESMMAATELVMKRITLRHYTAEEWLKAQIGEAAIQAAPIDAVQQWRHRWLDSLIKEFSK